MVHGHSGAGVVLGAVAVGCTQGWRQAAGPGLCCYWSDANTQSRCMCAHDPQQVAGVHHCCVAQGATLSSAWLQALVRRRAGQALIDWRGPQGVVHGHGAAGVVLGAVAVGWPQGRRQSEGPALCWWWSCALAHSFYECARETQGVAAVPCCNVFWWRWFGCGTAAACGQCFITGLPCDQCTRCLATAAQHMCYAQLYVQSIKYSVTSPQGQYRPVLGLSILSVLVL